MAMILGIPSAALFGQLVVGLLNGSFYAVLSLGLAVIFGMLRVINMAHGALFMLGGFLAWMMLDLAGVSFWVALLLAPLAVAALSIAIERFFLARLYQVDHLYGLLLTFGIAMVIEGLFTFWYGSSGRPYAVPSQLVGALDLGFLIVPKYRVFTVFVSLAICLLVWLLVERTKFGAYLRAATENGPLVQAFGVNVPLMLTLTYALGCWLAGVAGVLSAPIYQPSPIIGQNLIIVVFAVVVIGGMGSILGAVVTGYSIGVLEGLTKVFWPEASNTVIFILMAIVLLLRPAGLFGKN